MLPNTNKTRGFTIIELLVVIGILAVLATATTLIINPAELLKKARDTSRIKDLDALNKALDIAEVNEVGNAGDADRVYVSLPDENAPESPAGYSDCTVAYPGLPPVPGKTYACAHPNNLKKTNGTGWVPVDFESIPSGSPLTKLPIDPINSVADGKYYTYVMGGSWQLTALMEAKNHDAAVSDGGRMPGVYEIGTNLSLGPFTRDQGLVGYWPMDETVVGDPTKTPDASGSANVGTLTNGASLISDIDRIGMVASFDGTNDFIALASQPDFTTPNGLTFSSWVKRVLDNPSTQYIFSNDQFFMRAQPEGENAANPFEAFVQRPAGTYEPRASSGIAAAVGQWFHVAAIWDKTLLKIYVDGIFRGQSTRAGDIYGIPASAKIGSTSSGGSQWNGLIDDVRIYSRALSASEIQAIYNATK